MYTVAKVNELEDVWTVGFFEGSVFRPLKDFESPNEACDFLDDIRKSGNVLPAKMAQSLYDELRAASAKLKSIGKNIPDDDGATPYIEVEEAWVAFYIAKGEFEALLSLAKRFNGIQGYDGRPLTVVDLADFS